MFIIQPTVAGETFDYLFIIINILLLVLRLHPHIVFSHYH